MGKADDIKAMLRAKKKPAAALPFKRGLSTGSTLLNLACSGRSSVGLLPGFYYLFVGDSNSGKSFITLAMLAEAAINPLFDSHRLIYDPVEMGNQIDMRRMFGKLADRIEEPPHGRSTYIDDFFFNVDDAVKGDRPFVYILDSEDALDTRTDREKFDERKTASRKGKEITGSYGTSKAKENSAGVRRLINDLAGTQSIVVVISQTRDNIGFGAQFTPKTRSGGHALKFYATVEIWSSICKVIKKEVRGIDVQQGIRSKLDVKRSRFTGRACSVEVPIYWSSGIDDVGSCVDFLVAREHWHKIKGGITAPEFDWTGPTGKLVEKIETEGLEGRLRLTVSEVWQEIQSECEVKRKRRYE